MSPRPPEADLVDGGTGMRLSIRETEELRGDERARIVALCVLAHQEDDFRNLFSYIASGGRHFMAHRAGELVSHAVVTTRWLHAGGVRLRTAYVDAVATSPTDQGRGHASALMGMLARSIEDYEIGCLETDRPGFYERLGWQEWRGPLGGLTGDGWVATPRQRGVMVLRLTHTPDLDLEGPLAVETDGGRIW